MDKKSHKRFFIVGIIFIGLLFCGGVRAQAVDPCDFAPHPDEDGFAINDPFTSDRWLCEDNCIAGCGAEGENGYEVCAQKCKDDCYLEVRQATAFNWLLLFAELHEIFGPNEVTWKQQFESHEFPPGSGFPSIAWRHQTCDCNGDQNGGNAPFERCEGVDLVPSLQGFIFGEKIVEYTRKSFDEGSEEVEDGCVLAPGKRKLLRYALSVINIGRSPADLGDPEDPENDNFIFTNHPDNPHPHPHVKNMWVMELLDGNNVVVAKDKASIALVDSHPFCNDAEPKPNHLPEYQGVGSGWNDIYPAWLPCQYIDVTDLEPGIYTLRVTLNFGEDLSQRNPPVNPVLEECDYSNNVTEIEVTIPPHNTDYSTDTQDDLYCFANQFFQAEQFNDRCLAKAAEEE